MKFVLAVVAVVLMLMAGTAYADDGNVSPSMLADMGLSNMKVMSDAEGLAVRGKFAFVSGTANSSFFGNNATASYAAGDVGPGADFAAGAGVALSGGAIIFPGGAWGAVIVGSVSGAVAFAGP